MGRRTRHPWPQRASWSGLIALVSMLGADPAAALQPGRLIISELMPNPDTVLDSNAEWIELYNQGAAISDLRGLVVSDQSGASHTIAGESPIPLASGAHFLLARSADPQLTDGVVPDQVYAIVLDNGGDTVRVHDGPTLIAEAAYPLTGSGISLQMETQPAPGIGTYVSDSTAAFYGAFNRGTPGELNEIPLPLISIPSVPIGWIGRVLLGGLLSFLAWRRLTAPVRSPETA